MRSCILLVGCALVGSAQTTLWVGSATQPAYAGRYAIAPGALIVASTFLALPTTDPSAIQLELQPSGSSRVFTVPVIAVKSGIAWAIAPSDIPLGRATATLTVNNQRFSGTAYFTTSSFSLFSAVIDGSGPAIAQNITITGDPEPNQLTNPATPGQYVTLWGTGIGGFGAADVVVDVFGTTVRPSYAGHAPGQPGLDQINFQLPEDTPNGCYVPVRVTVDGDDVSNTVTVATSATAGSPCEHPLGLSAEQLKTLDLGGRVITGSLFINSIAYRDNQSGAFRRDESAQVQFMAATAPQTFYGPLARPFESPSCSFTGPFYVSALPAGPYAETEPVVFSDAGPAVSISGPGEKALKLPKDTSVYTKSVTPTLTAPTIATLAPPFFGGGSWTFSGPGGADLAAFQQVFTLPASLAWTNRDTLATIDRTDDLTITWDNGANDPGETVDVFLYTSPPAGDSLNSALYAGISCLIAARTGKLVIPSQSLESLTPTLPGFSSALHVGISSDAVHPRLLSIPVQSGGMAPMVVYRSSGETIPVTVQ